MTQQSLIALSVLRRLRRSRVKLLWLWLFLDQGIKQWWLSSGRVVELNSGVAGGLGAGFDWLAVMVGLIAWVYYKFGWRWQVGLMVIGGLSNLLDRLRWGGVVDYINFFNLFSFNLADGLVVVGMLGLIYKEVYGAKDNI